MDVTFEVEDYRITLDVINLTPFPLTVLKDGIVIPTNEIISFIDEGLAGFTFTHSLETSGSHLYMTTPEVKDHIKKLYPELVVRCLGDKEPLYIGIAIDSRQPINVREKRTIHLDVSNIVSLKEFDMFYYMLYLNSKTYIDIIYSHTRDCYTVFGTLSSNVKLITKSRVISLDEGSDYIIIPKESGYDIHMKGKYYPEEQIVSVNGQPILFSRRHDNTCC